MSTACLAECLSTTFSWKNKIKVLLVVQRRPMEERRSRSGDTSDGLEDKNKGFCCWFLGGLIKPSVAKNPKKSIFRCFSVFTWDRFKIVCCKIISSLVRKSISVFFVFCFVLVFIVRLWNRFELEKKKWLEWFGTYTSIALNSKTQSIDCLKSIFTPQRAPEARDFDVIFFGALHKCRLLAAFVNYWKCSDQLRSSALLHRCNHGPGTQVNRYYP